MGSLQRLNCNWELSSTWGTSWLKGLNTSWTAVLNNCFGKSAASANVHLVYTIRKAFLPLRTFYFSIYYGADGLWEVQLEGSHIFLTKYQTFLTRYWVNLSKRGGKDGVFRGLTGLLRGIFEGEARGKSRGAALPGRGKPRPSQLFYSDLHSIFNTVFQSTEVSRRVNFVKRYFSSLQIAYSDTTFFSWIVCAEFFFDYVFCCKTPVKSCKKALRDCDKSWSMSWVEYHIFSWDQFFRAFWYTKLWTVITSKRLELLT